jgi:hypothetical protein
MIRRTLIVAVAVTVFASPAAAAWATPSDAAGAFRDDDGSVHEPNINGIKAAAITSGCNPPANTNFCPTRSLTRAELATLFVRAFGLSAAPPAGFQDTAGNEHAANIDALAAAGITKGCNPPGNTRFCPDRITSRGEMASFLVRALALLPAPSQPFVDVAGSVHRDDIAALAFGGITKGCNPPTNDRFCPDAAVNRAETASFLVRSLPGVSPIYNTLSLSTGIFCSKDGESCRRSFTAPRGMQWEVTDGWYHVIPFLAGEETVFGSARLEIEVNGVPIALTGLFQTQSGSLVKRLFTAVLPATGTGTTTIVARWRWNGTVVRTLTIRSTS